MKMKKDTGTLQEAAIAVLQSLKGEEIENTEYEETVKDFDVVLKNLNLKTVQDRKDLKFLVDQIRIAVANADNDGEESAFRQDFFFEEPEKYEDIFSFNLKRYEFEALEVLNFFGLKKDNTVRVRLIVFATTTGYEFLVNEKHSIVNAPAPVSDSDTPEIAGIFPRQYVNLSRKEVV